MTIKIKGILEIDQARGVIYFHSKQTGHSPLRICSLPKPIPNPTEYGNCLDITHMIGTNWKIQYKCIHHGCFSDEKPRCKDCVAFT